MSAPGGPKVAGSPSAGRVEDGCCRALESPELKMIARCLAAAGISAEDCVRESARITESAETHRRLEEMVTLVTQSIANAPSGSFERFVLVHTTLRYRTQLESAPVPQDVKEFARRGLLNIIEGRRSISLTDHLFVAFCQIATLRRFPAGQFDWDRSGLPRSWIPRVRPLSSLTQLMSTVAIRWRAFSPAFFIHVGVTYPVQVLLEREAVKSYYRMAKAMALQPEIKGLIASSWLHSPDTFAVSPHLAWLNKVFGEHGAVVATMGAASPDCGVLTRNVERQRAFDEGLFTPTLGLIVWDRRDMLAWAAGHPELDR